MEEDNSRKRSRTRASLCTRFRRKIPAGISHGVFRGWQSRDVTTFCTSISMGRTGSQRHWPARSACPASASRTITPARVSFFRGPLSVIPDAAAHGYSDAVIAVAEDVRDFLIRYEALPPDKVVTIANGIDTRVFPPVHSGGKIKGPAEVRSSRKRVDRRLAGPARRRQEFRAPRRPGREFARSGSRDRRAPARRRHLFEAGSKNPARPARLLGQVRRGASIFLPCARRVFLPLALRGIADDDPRGHGLRPPRFSPPTGGGIPGAIVNESTGLLADPADPETFRRGAGAADAIARLVRGARSPSRA